MLQVTLARLSRTARSRIRPDANAADRFRGLPVVDTSMPEAARLCGSVPNQCHHD
jgi:hypothetical protein